MSLVTASKARGCGLFVSAVLATFSSLCESHAQTWQVIRLHPPGATESAIYGTAGSQQAGVVDDHAYVWSSTTESGIDLNPVGASASSIAATNGTTQGGSATVGGQKHTAIWSGTAASFVDLNPPGATSSEITAISANRQGGYAVINGAKTVGYWTGTANSFTQVAPPPPRPTSTMPTVLGYGYNLTAITSTGAAGTSYVVYSGMGEIPSAELWPDCAAPVEMTPSGMSGSTINAATETQ